MVILMKKMFFSSMLVLGLLSSCSKDDNNEQLIWDLAPIEFKIDVVEDNGKSIIDPNSPVYNQTFLENTTIKVQGNTYRWGEDANVPSLKPSSRAFYAPFYGIKTEQIKDKSLLVIGPFMADYQWDKETVEINWGDGSKDVLTFTSNMQWTGKDGAPVFTKREYLVNDADSTDVFTSKGYIVLKKPLKQ